MNEAELKRLILIKEKYKYDLLRDEGIISDTTFLISLVYKGFKLDPITDKEEE